VNSNIQALHPVASASRRGIEQTAGQTGQGNSFATELKEALNRVSEAEHASNMKTEMLAQGKIDNLHDVMITAQKANITVETAVQIQQKVIDTYNEMMRMQV